MPLTLRLRRGGRTVALDGLPEGITLAQFRKLVSEKTGVPPARLILKLGVPPKPLPDDLPSQLLLECGCRDRDTVIAEEREATDAAYDAAEHAEPGACGGTKPWHRAPATEDGGAGAGVVDAPSSELLPAFDRAIRAATEHARILPEDQHQVWALRRAKAAVLESLKRGDNISLGALHTLKGIGHWVVQEVKRHLEEGGRERPPSKRRATGERAVAPPTPQSFQWWYLDKAGKAVTDRNSAHFSGPPGAEQFRVCILHSSGRMERAWLPDAKAPPRCQPAPSH
mmetsp:Transcript_10140/g.30400  ORF Transcript_10140/g.30400 Transcript_10140/m.30400 type:complete len:283 (+) Transcript_10140:55-903(+)